MRFEPQRHEEKQGRSTRHAVESITAMWFEPQRHEEEQGKSPRHAAP
jgi:hypothetical protein